MFRLIEMVIPIKKEAIAKKILENLNVLDMNYIHISEKKTKFHIIIPKKSTEEVLESLQNNFSSIEGFSIVLLHVYAYLPRPADNKEDKRPSIYDIKNERISREEIYNNVIGMTTLNSTYLLMVILSSLVASIGVLNNNVAIIIASMIIAPLLGPGIGLSYGLINGDRKLAIMAVKSSLV